MPRQLQLTQNLLDRAATAWNVVYSTVSFLINFPSHFEAFVKWIDSLDPSQALASSKIGAYLLNSAARQADGAWKAAKGRALQRKGHTNPVDESPSEHFVDQVRRRARHGAAGGGPAGADGPAGRRAAKP